MRFAYIDSQGNEVSIPSVDALALRIELGAIDSETQLYDEQADYWGPASTHEIFHTLSRDQGEEGYLAPPPMAPPPPSITESAPEEEPAEPPPPSITDFAPDEESAEPAPSIADFAPDEEPSAAPPTAEPTEASPGEAPVFEPSADEPVETPPAPEPPPAAPAEPDTELRPLGPDDPLPVFDVSGEFGGDAGDTKGADVSGFDDLEAPLSGSHERLAPTGDHDLGFGSGDADFAGFEDASREAGAMSFGDAPDPDDADTGTLPHLALGPSAADDLDGLDSGSSIAGLGEDEPPPWIGQAEPHASDLVAGGSDAMSLVPDAGVGGTSPLGKPAATGLRMGERPEPKDRPSAPRRRKERSSVPVVMGVVVIVGVGGFFGWRAMSAASGRPDPAGVDTGPPPVVMPFIPADLVPTMQDLADAAMADMLAEFRAMQREFDLRAEPNDDWLAGVYLGTASRFGDVEQYWLGIGRFLDRVREVDTQVFHDKYVARVEATGMASDTAAMLVERADAGFLATREARSEAYGRLDELIDAALDLHFFDSDNELEITYDPAAGGMSRDPVLEAVPSTEALGDEMWGMVDRITSALDALEMLEKVTTERLVAVLLAKIERAGIQ